MRVSSVKTFFHVVGAIVFFIGFFAFLIGLALAEEGEDLLAVTFVVSGCACAGSALYCFAGAPKLTNAIVRRFPAQALSSGRPRRENHGLKAAIGFVLGAAGMLLLALSIAIDPGSISIPAWVVESMLGASCLSPLPSTWGAMHLAWRRGHSPAIPCVVAVAGFLAASFSFPLGLALATVGPPMVVAVLRPSFFGSR